jgi:hypothetical protein
LGKKKSKKAIKELKKSGVVIPDDVKSNCCKKFKKGENKFCKTCPYRDFLKKVA